MDLTRLVPLLNSKNLQVRYENRCISIGGHTLTSNVTVTSFLSAVLGREDARTLSEEITDWEIDRKEFVREMRSLAAEDEISPISTELLDLVFPVKPIQGGLYSDLVDKSTDCILLRKSDYSISPLPMSCLRDSVGAKYFKSELIPKAPIYEFVFDTLNTWEVPVRPPTISEADGVVNAYVKPKIFTTRKKSDASTKHIVQWLRYFFSDKEQRDFALCWLANAAIRRAKTVLILSGREETGKTTLAKLLMGLVTGCDPNYDSYFCKGRLHGRNDRFNDEYNYARVLFFDEYKLHTSNQVDFLKEIVEDRQSREGKFKARKTVINTLSVLVCNNTPSDIRIPPATGRKLSVLDVPTKKMSEVFDREFLNNLHAELENPESIAKVYFWLNHKYLNKYPADYALHTKTYEKMTLASAPQFIQDFIKEEIDDKPLAELEEDMAWDINDIFTYNKQKGRGNKTSESVVIDFFTHYKVNGSHVLNFLYSDGPLQLTLTKEYLGYITAKREINAS